MDIVRRMKLDLHVHSNASDGVYRPADVVRKAHDNGVEVIALTDHDTVAGLKEASCEARRLGMRFIDGVELSCAWGEKTIHVVGLGMKELEPYMELTDKLSRMRDERAKQMAIRIRKHCL